jgi:chemosensory pili system protein ChpA (sensor histidine kinase/response regulator)
MTTRVGAEVLSWVKVEIDYALNVVRDRTQKYLANPEDVASLKVCPSQLHQVAGALRIVGLEGAARVCDMVESAFAGIEKERMSAKTADAVDRAVFSLGEFVDDLSRGEPNTPVRLFPVYRELAKLQGRSDVSEKDFFLPDLARTAPAHPARASVRPDELAAFLKNQRAGFQRGLIAWLRSPGEPGGADEMRGALDALDTIAAQLPEPRALWWSACGLVECLAQPPGPAWTASARLLCSRIDISMRDLAAGAHKCDEQLLREILYAIGTCGTVSPRVSAIKRLYQLDHLLPGEAAPEAMEFDMDWLKPALIDARSRLDGIKSTWIQYVAGEPHTLKRFREQVTGLKTRVDELGNHQLVRLLDAIALVSTLLADPYPRQSQMMVIEMASAFLLAESILDNFTDPPADLEHQITVMGGWVLDASKGKSTGQPPAGLRADLCEQIGMLQLQGQVAREILTNLEHVEQVLDAFARDVAKRDGLPPLAAYLRQIHGALVMLHLPRAAELLSLCQDMIAECAHAGGADTAQKMDTIAEGLSSLGLSLDPCLRGRAPLDAPIDLFFTRRNEQSARAAIAAEESARPVPLAAPPETPSPVAAVLVESAALVEPAMPAEPPAASAPALSAAPALPPAPDPAIPTADDELLDVFLEEAGEVLQALTQALSQCRAEPANREALTIVRRGFHTLKGSGRMVGLTELGDAAWEIEQVMNRWLDDSRPATPELIALIEAAGTAFGGWIGELVSHRTLKIDASQLVGLARNLQVPTPEAITTPAPEPEITIGNVHLSVSFYEMYRLEAAQHLAALQACRQWTPAPPAGSLQDFMRAAHTLAGISRTAGLMPVAALASALEQLAPHCRLLANEADTLFVRGAVEKLEEMLSAIARHSYPFDSKEEIENIDALIRRLQARPQAEPVHVPASPAAPTPDIALTCLEPIDDAGLVRAAAVIPATKEQRSVRDDIDAEVLPIFLEEAAELLPVIGNDLRSWKAGATDPQVLQSLRRALHTVKGSARMAGAMRLGELAHLMESKVETALESGTPPPQTFAELESEMDRLAGAIERLHSSVDQPRATTDAVEASSVTIAPAEAPGPAAAMLRLNADKLDWLINESGELSIARSRVESELGTLKRSLLELNDSVARLRGQLREVEIQADSQLQSRESVLDFGHHDFDPLEFDRYTRLQELTRMMVESVHDVTTVQQGMLKNLGEVDAALLQQGRINRDLQQELMHVRTVPFSNLNERQYRVVRQAARDLDKKANLEIRGSQVEVDRSILERIVAPLEHMLRNAVAHGLESPAERTAAGKPEIGEITITLQQESNEVALVVSDDGRGLDTEKLRRVAVEKGLAAPDREMSEAELIELIFTPGFSTAAEVTDLSGRGVGMDVVRNEILAIGGRIETTTSPGKGTTFTIYLPFTLAVTQALVLGTGEETFAVPSAMVEQVLRLKAGELAQAYGHGTIETQGRRYPLHSLRQLLTGASGPPEVQTYNSVLLLRSGIHRAAVHVDELIGNQEIVVKNIGPQLSGVPGITGATVLGDGRIVLILNPVQLALRPAAAIPQAAVPELRAARPGTHVVMVVDDSLTVRKITGRLLEREGYRVLTAKDGAEALSRIKDTIPDVMLVDIEMPGMDGFDLTRNVRNDPKTAGIPILIISSRTAEKHRLHALQLGANEFLGKPYQEADLLLQVSRYANEPRAVTSPTYPATYH